MPDPQEGESKEDFMSRCMGDDKMVDEFGNPQQRAAVCNSYYERKDATAKMEDYIFSNPEGARKKSEEIGMDGEIHESRMADGTPMYFPGKTEEEFIEWYRKNDPDARQELSALQYGRPGKNDPRKTPAKPSERRKGSKKNPPGSAKKPNNSIQISKETESRLQKMMTEHNAKVADKGKGSRASMGMLKTVFRRGAGAFSRTHAPNMSRGGWGIARVKAFLYLLRNGRPSNPNYKQDNDLLPKSHPRGSSEEDYEDWDDEIFSAAEYQGRKVKLNKPFRTPDGPKKFAVYTKNEKGTVVIVRFGDPNMEIKRDDPQRRKNFRSRHNCDNPGPKWKARYWSCYQWRSGSKVEGSEFNKTPYASYNDMGCDCGCGGCGSYEADEHSMPSPKNNESHDEFMSRCEEMGFSTQECMDAHQDHEFMEEASYHTDGECQNGYEKRNGMCVKVAFELDVDVKVDEIIVEASTGRQVVRITGIAFHDGINKNGWQITRAGAELAVSQMYGADLTLNHPPSENGRFKRNMNGGVEDAVVGIVTEAFIVDSEQGWEVGFKAEVHRPELFEALESGLWLREGYGVSIGGTGIPDMVTQHKDGSTVMTFESDFKFDHLAIVHRPAYKRAVINTVEKVMMEVAQDESFISQDDNGVNTEKVNIMTDENKISIEASEEVVENVAEEVVETPDYASEIEALKASLAERENELAEIRAAEEAKAEEVRASLVEKATSLGMSGHEDLPSSSLESLIASWESSKPAVEMKPIKASTETTEVSRPVSEDVVANFLNGRKLNTPEAIYEKAFNVWASAWNKTHPEFDMKAPTYVEAKEKHLI
jgi:hypothetical protein